MTTLPLCSNFLRFSIAAPLVALGLLWSSAAQAASPLVVTADSPYNLGGDKTYYYNTVTIKDGGVLSVIPVGTEGGTGRVHIIANRIIIEGAGILNASGKGHRGLSGQQGNGPGGGGYAVNYSGGGGAYFGDGGAGTNPMCATGIFGIGGMKYGTTNLPTDLAFALGSAGGAGGKTQGPIGGNGGGSVILEAAEIEVFGTINVSGDPGLSYNAVGSGGGAGGEIRMQASRFTWGPKARLIAAGGLGGKTPTPLESGGSGGGGLIWIRGAPEPPAEVELNVLGGASPEGCAGGIGKGADGTISIDSTPFACRDLDGDGYGSSLCLGDDCDDADAKIHPMAKDVCDNVDNDCNKTIDDGAEACAAGLTCVSGTCESTIMPDGGMGSDGGTQATLETLEYRGGCSVPSAPSSAAPLAALGAAFAFGLHVARRNRRKPH